MAAISRPIPSNGYSLEELSEGAPIFQFTSVDNIERTILDLQDDFIEDSRIFFQDTPYNAFQQLCTIESSILGHCRLLYLEGIKILRVEMPPPSPQHEAAAVQFGATICSRVEQMNLKAVFVPRGSSMAHMGQVHKMPDGCWGPMDKRYITLVAEVGVSESQQSLKIDAHRWIESPDSHVQQVVTIKIYSDRPLLVFRVWEPATAAYTATRSGCLHVARMAQEVTASLVDNIPTITGSLSIQFSKIFERPPTPGTAEGDIIFDQDDLLCIAEHVWRILNQMPPA